MANNNMSSDEYYQYYLEQTQKKDKKNGKVFLAIIPFIGLVGTGLFYLSQEKPQETTPTKKITKTLSTDKHNTIKEAIEEDRKEHHPTVKMHQTKIVKQKSVKPSKKSEQKIKMPKSKIIKKEVITKPIPSEQKKIKNLELSRMHSVERKMPAVAKKVSNKIAIEKKESKHVQSLKTKEKTRANEIQYVTVEQGDTLFDIAKRVYGDAMLYTHILEANPDILNNAAQISIGQKLKVPTIKPKKESL